VPPVVWLLSDRVLCKHGTSRVIGSEQLVEEANIEL
jgi:hypothetical protein